MLDNPPRGNPWELKISEASSNLISGTPPYLDALDKFQSNPYYFFVGEILRGGLEKGLDPRAGLIYALELALSVEMSRPREAGSIGRDAGSHLHSMDSEREFYETKAMRRAIDDCVDASDRLSPRRLHGDDHGQPPDVGPAPKEFGQRADEEKNRNDGDEICNHRDYVCFLPWDLPHGNRVRDRTAEFRDGCHRQNDRNKYVW